MVGWDTDEAPKCQLLIQLLFPEAKSGGAGSIPVGAEPGGSRAGLPPRRALLPEHVIPLLQAPGLRDRLEPEQ